MTLLKAATRFAVAAAAVASVAFMAPAAQASSAAGGTIATYVDREGGAGTAEAPIGRQCGAYRDATHLWYKHCGDTYIVVEIDKINRSNTFTCVGPRADVVLDSLLFSDNAWYAGQLC
ncbi:DUF6355 family natural product biosynthesis protein [Nonomuraea rhodomycinica]|uniref:DUF6355 family natural product biosynthesis protein n=1 Tax=Nonomuraea rhodomycinica TaxID=1712872 RepID=UPI0035E4482A